MKYPPKGIRGKHTIAELAYAAGLIDGEGHIIIFKDDRTKNLKYKTKNPTYILIVGCTNTEPAMIDFLADRWGACRQTRGRQRANWKRTYEWTIQSDMALNFLKEIYPYMIIKQWKAKLAIEFQQGMKWRKIGSGKITPIEEILRREKIWQQLNLHRKAPKAIQQVFAAAETNRSNTELDR